MPGRSTKQIPEAVVWIETSLVVLPPSSLVPVNFMAPTVVFCIGITRPGESVSRQPIPTTGTMRLGSPEKSGLALMQASAAMSVEVRDTLSTFASSLEAVADKLNAAKTKTRTAELRAQLPFQEIMQAGTFMVGAVAECATELGGP